jgi:hypothetical protein
MFINIKYDDFYKQCGWRRLRLVSKNNAVIRLGIVTKSTSVKRFTPDSQ